MFTSIHRKRRAFIALLTILAMLASAAVSFAAGSSVSISGYTSPSTLKVGRSFTIKGKLNSNYTITRVEVGIAKDKNNWTKYKYDNKKVNARTFDLKRADSTLKFGKLKKGTYYYRVYAHTSDGKVHTVLNKKFKVKKSSGKKVGVSISGVSAPFAIAEGKGFNIRGKIKSSKKIKSVKVGVTYANGTWTSVKYTKKKINAKSFNIKKVDSKIKFGKLAEGSYKFRVDVTTTGGTKTLVNKDFVVNCTYSGTESNGFSNGSGAGKEVQVITEDTSANRALDGNDSIKLINFKKPGNYKVGGVFTPSGKIQSDEKINKIEIGIIFAPTNKWTSYKYTNNNVDEKSFDVSRAASKLSFNKLPGGTYKYRIYVHTNKGIVTVLNHAFTVKPSSNPQKAVNWAVKIANDNTFNYGKIPKTSRPGCYFCGTNQKKKPKGYEKTYVCITFAGAAYAHGAGDPEILSECKKGHMTMYENNSNFTEFNCWMKIGSCADLKISDLQPGDVLMKWDNNNAYGHACIYVGGDKLVEAAISGWSAKSIRVTTGASSRLKSLGSNKKNYVMRYTR